MPHVLITADAVGGVWSHVRELALGLRRRRWRVTVALLGPMPDSGAMGWAADSGVEILRGPSGLEWMPGAAAEVREGQRWLEAQLRALHPDLLHANQFSAAVVPGRVPVLLGVHSDLVSWWRAVHQCQPPKTAFGQTYEASVRAAMAAAAVVVAPTRATLEDLRTSYGDGAWRSRSRAIPNGVDAAGWGPPSSGRRLGYAAAAGRIWDAGKQMRLLCQPGLALPIHLAGAWREPGAEADRTPPYGMDMGRLPEGVQWEGELSRAGMRSLLAGAEVFIVPSRYEPFGLGALEAALSGCALLLHEIPSLREVWGGAAAYFRGAEANALARALGRFATRPRWRRQMARAARRRALEHYGADLMAERYAAAYRQAISGQPQAARGRQCVSAIA